jgi:hypothetical protein
MPRTTVWDKKKEDPRRYCDFQRQSDWPAMADPLTGLSTHQGDQFKLIQ